jgi:hypothetical protein
MSIATKRKRKLTILLLEFGVLGFKLLDIFLIAYFQYHVSTPQGLSYESLHIGQYMRVCTLGNTVIVAAV